MASENGLFSALDQTWVCLHEHYESARRAGFTDKQAIAIIVGMTRS